MQKILGLFSLCLLFSIGCSRQFVDPGNVGVQVNFYGEEKGVDDKVLTSGAYWYNSWTSNIYEYPTFMQQAVWTQSTTEGSPNDESISFNSSEGSPINVDVGVAYAFKAEKVPHVFKKFRQDANTITHGYLRSRVRDAFNEHASTYKAADIFGSGKVKLLKEVTETIKTQLNEEGFEIDNISFLSKFRVDSNLEAAINRTIQASQQAIEAENKVKQIEAEAQQAIAKAKGTSESVLLEAKAKAEANIILAKSITPELVQYEALQKWDGKMPTYMSGNGQMPFITVQGK